MPPVAILGSLALLAALVAPLSEWGKGSRSVRLWATLPLVIAGLAFAMGGRLPGLHMLASAGTAAILGRNAIAFRGVGRWSSAFACVAWIGSMVTARLLFG